MIKPRRPSPLNDFERRLRDARKRSEKPGSGGKPGSATPSGPFGFAFRIGVELAAGLLVGGGIGYFLDAWLGTSPLMLILFFFLGAAAGMLNVYRGSRRLWPQDLPDGERDGTPKGKG